MTVFDLHWNLEQEINLLSNNNNPGLNDREKDRLLNIAQDDYRDLFFYGNNRKGLMVEGFEANKQKLDMFRGLVYGYPQQPKIQNPTTLDDNYYSFDLTKATNFWSYISCELETDCGDFKVRIPQHNDGVERDFHKKTSKIWKVANALIENNDLVFKCVDFVPLAIKLKYLKKPREIRLGTYPDITLANQQTNPPNLLKQEPEISSEFHYLLISIAAQNYMRIYAKEQYSLLKDKINQVT
jgi:hypothetical protein